MMDGPIRSVGRRLRGILLNGHLNREPKPVMMVVLVIPEMPWSGFGAR
jgi:hypothetical protein